MHVLSVPSDLLAPSVASALSDAPMLSALVADIGIPPCPDMLLRLRAELARTPPRSEELARIAMTDVAVSAALLKAAYAPWLGRGRGRGTLAQAFERLGPVRCTALLSALALREVLPAHGPSLERFWDVAHRRSVAMAWLARRHGEVAPDVAQTFGLFCDVGIPVLLQRFESPSYRATLAEANLGFRAFTEVERGRHGTDHAVVGAALARTWGVGEEIVEAVCLHHDYRVLGAEHRRRPSSLLIALALVAERMIQLHRGRNRHGEWLRGGVQALAALGMSEDDFEDWSDEIRTQMVLSGP
ncbi:HDOD domain-containing protein [Sphaerotilus montanus]|uniref:HD-like signal output (HDOD) protein n=1 Tax=Sphaerotilus montanus TaxID=522889 RepID=A0A7Y9U8Y2_9BURK|nr:HDOD domain-containing protein [Sphaerotilus montanus]NYG35111.1 HD-like signal output (HDOD) protein [Sphaerotilus montanus]NZD56035.1 HDOD domain-containing protein [Sphaerotilus montanus]